MVIIATLVPGFKPVIVTVALSCLDSVNDAGTKAGFSRDVVPGMPTLLSCRHPVGRVQLSASFTGLAGLSAPDNNTRVTAATSTVTVRRSSFEPRRLCHEPWRFYARKYI